MAAPQAQPDPTVRSFLIERIGPAGVDVKVVTARLTQEQDASVRRTIVLSLGQFDREHLLLGGREPLVGQLLNMYRNDPDAGVHSAVEWLLRQWGEAAMVEKIDRGLATGQVVGDRRWYVSREGQTMMIVPPAGVVTVGQVDNSKATIIIIPPTGVEMLGQVDKQQAKMIVPPAGEATLGQADQRQYKERLDWCFAIAAKDVTVEQFRQCPQFKNFHSDKQSAPTVDCPVNNVTWYDAAAYCNWLTQQELPKDQWESQCCYLPWTTGVNARE